MKQTSLFSIGEMAEMFSLSVSSLRHYEAIGLLTPEWVDPQTGYRYYSTRQFEVLNTVRYLRMLGVPLAEIGHFLHGRDIEKMEEMLRRQKRQVEQKQRELAAVARKIENRLSDLSVATHCHPAQIREEILPAGRLVWLQNGLREAGGRELEISLKKLENAQREPLIFLGKVGLSGCLGGIGGGKENQHSVFLQANLRLSGAKSNFLGEAVVIYRAVFIRTRGNQANFPLIFLQRFQNKPGILGQESPNAGFRGAFWYRKGDSSVGMNPQVQVFYGLLNQLHRYRLPVQPKLPQHIDPPLLFSTISKKSPECKVALAVKIW